MLEQNLHERELRVLLDDNGRQVEVEDVDLLIDVFSEALTLQHWTIKWSLCDESKMGKSLMKIVPLRDRNMAKIFIKSTLIGRPLREFGPLLLHELIHLVLDPILEETTYQIEYEIAEARTNEYNKRILRVVERTIEHLTMTLGKFIQIPRDILPTAQSEVLKSIKEELEAGRSYNNVNANKESDSSGISA